ncbi:hypothetical protein KIL84_009542 [Mauremys mutica]|uniref:Uncharacterized protein n=1 Tax=Mauremys mutica TaxID=74926 RepID=A0A9D4ANT4_9SAUR|nr:hypothetical protein KIL84_009542 [Mauremys mutica]
MRGARNPPAALGKGPGCSRAAPSLSSCPPGHMEGLGLPTVARTSWAALTMARLLARPRGRILGVEEEEQGQGFFVPRAPVNLNLPLGPCANTGQGGPLSCKRVNCTRGPERLLRLFQGACHPSREGEGTGPCPQQP